MEGVVGTNAWGPEAREVRALKATQESLLFLLDQFFRSGPACPGIDPVCPKIDQVLTYLSRAFAREERVMDAVGFPDLSGHRADHAALIESLTTIRATHACGRYDTGLMFRFLADWADAHIDAFDRPLMAFIEHRRIGNDKTFQ